MLFAGSEGGGAIFGEGVIVGVHCPTYTLAVDVTWSTPCGVLPGEEVDYDDPYGEPTIVVHDPCKDRHGKLAGKTEAELLGKIVQFWRVHNRDGCEAEYHIVEICFNPGCERLEVST